MVTTLAGRYVYLVTGTTIVSPDDYQAVIPTIDPTMATLTLTSCHPKYSAQQRIVIASALDVDQSSPLTVTTETTQTSETTETSELPTDASTPADTQPGNTEPTGTQPANTEPGNTQPGNTEPAGTPPVAGQDLFENRWFSDPDAFGQVALWGTLLTIVSLAAWAISRRARRNWIGGLVGVVPFVIVLYFFFENVNRLLPPNL